MSPKEVLNNLAQITDAQSPVVYFRTRGFSLTATEIAASIRMAANDDRIDGLYMTVQVQHSAGDLPAKFERQLIILEPRQALRRVWEMYMTKGYYLASA